MDDPTRYKRAIGTFKAQPRQRGWEYEVEVEGFDLTFFAYDVQFPLFDLGTDEDASGSLTRTKYTQEVPRSVEMTCSETENGDLRKWLEDWKDVAFPGDGAHAHPDDFVREFIFQPLTNTGEIKQEPFKINLKPVKAEGSWGYNDAQNLELQVSLVEHNTGRGETIRPDRNQ